MLIEVYDNSDSGQRTFPFLEKRCFKSVALVAEDKPLTHKLRLLPLLFTEPPTVFFLSKTQR